MIKELEKFIQEQHLFTKDDHILVTVSGGSDSVCLTHLLFELGYKISIAHCNFQLRGKESDGDEVFVKKLAKKLKVKFFLSKFDTTQFAKKNKLSIQVAARQLRYNWFQEILDKHTTIKHVATAHHLNDSIESFFINLSRGTGIDGLTRIPLKRKNIVRPLSQISKKQIDQYIKKNKIDFREDSSNKEEKYKRNIIRKKMIPLLKKLNPSYENSFLETFINLEQTALLQNNYLQSVSKSYYKKDKSTLLIDLDSLQKDPAKKSVLHFILSPFGFNHHQVNDILRVEKDSAGKSFLSVSYEAHTHRRKLIVSEKKEKATSIFIAEKTNSIKKPIRLSFKEIKNEKNVELKLPQNKALIDADTLKFPLTLRPWKEGDKFIPLGMKGFKKMSDFFISQKMSHQEKNNTWLLCSQGKIVWVVGKRIDDRNKITKSTKKIIEITLRNG